MGNWVMILGGIGMVLVFVVMVTLSVLKKEQYVTLMPVLGMVCGLTIATGFWIDLKEDVDDMAIVKEEQAKVAEGLLIRLQDEGVLGAGKVTVKNTFRETSTETRVQVQVGKDEYRLMLDAEKNEITSLLKTGEYVIAERKKLTE